jgi:peptide/nickel transport system substrate-binding protein
MNFTNLDIAQLAMYVDIDGMEPEDAAALWLADNCARWTGWASADASACPEAPEAPAAAPEPESFDIRIAIGPEIQDVDPQRSNAVWNTVMLWGNVTEALVTTDDNGVLVPELAESIEVLNDGLTWRITLKEGVSFHNGEPFNAEAVKYSLDRITSEEFASLILDYFKDYEATNVIDEFTLDILTKKTSPDFLDALTYVAMLPPVFTESDPSAQNDHPTGTGPYTFTSKTADALVITKNADYHGGAVPGPQTVTGMARPEISSRVAGLSAGNEFEIALDIPAELIGEVPAVSFNAPSGTMMLWMNGYNGITQDPRVREAIVLGVDQEGIRKALIGEANSQSGQCQFGVPGSSGYNPALEEQSYDPERARELIEEAGVVGESIRFAVPTARYVAGEEIAEVVIEQLEAIGLVIEYDLSPYQTWLDSLFEPRDSRAELFFTRAGGVTPSLSKAWGLFVVSEGYLEMIGHDNYPGLNDKVLSALGEMDPDTRTGLFVDATEGVCDTNGFAFLYKENGIVGHLESVGVPERADPRIYWSNVTMAG